MLQVEILKVGEECWGHPSVVLARVRKSLMLKELSDILRRRSVKRVRELLKRWRLKIAEVE